MKSSDVLFNGESISSWIYNLSKFVITHPKDSRSALMAELAVVLNKLEQVEIEESNRLEELSSVFDGEQNVIQLELALNVEEDDTPF